jgi:protein bicaudal D
MRRFVFQLNFFLFSAVESNPKDKMINDKLTDVVSQYTNWFQLSAGEIDGLKVDLAELQKELNCSDAMTILRNEITNLKNKVTYKF